MPNYSFRDGDGVIHEFNMKISELDDFKAKNTHLTQTIVGAPATISGTGTRIKTDDGFKEVLSKVKETYTINNIKD
jgi:hypothetical protein